MKNQSQRSTCRGLTTVAAILCGTVVLTMTAVADVTVKVDSFLPWLGFMNVWQTNGTSYVYGQTWGPADLRAAFIHTNSPSGWPQSTLLVLSPNTNTYAPGTGKPPDTNFWNLTDGTPNKVVEANFYRDVGTNFAGQTVTFTGTILSNNIPSVNGFPTTGWDLLAVVKEFSVGYGTFYGMNSVPISAAGPFTVSRPIPAGRVCQYGFIV